MRSGNELLLGIRSIARLRWSWAAPVMMIVTLLSAYPLLHMPLTKRGEWRGSFPYLQPDELPYAAYLKAIVSGHPRRNNPYTGEHDQPGAPLAESSYSIQFPIAYAAAAVARVFGLSTSATFAVLMVIAALGSSLALFWLIVSVTGNERLAATGALFVLCLGSVLTLWGLLQILRGLPPDFTHFRFSRRYVPAMAFPFLIAFCTLVWLMLTARRVVSRLAVFLASLVFVILVFSYFYYWTAAIAWLACLALLWLLARPAGWQRALLSLGAISALGVIPLVPYSWLMSKRAPDQDVANLLVRTHAPDVFRIPQLASVALLVVVVICCRSGLLRFRDQPVLFAVAFLLWPFPLFNQQIITGLSLQPTHYEVFVANYGVLLAVVLIAGTLYGDLSRKAQKRFNASLVFVALIAIGWAAFEVGHSTVKYAPAFTTRDDVTPAAMRLAELVHKPNAESGAAGDIVLATDPVVSDYLPTVAPQPVFWSPHMYVFAGVTALQDKLRLSQFMYYTDVRFDETIDARQFERLDPLRKMYFTALMGRSRTDRSLTNNWKPIDPEEYSGAQRGYADFVASFNRDLAAHPVLSYVLVADDRPIDFTHLDRWYERTEKEQIGRFILYRVRLRP